jgi:hypothetical protein
MPTAVIVVHDERNTRELAVSALREAFLEAVGIADPMRRWMHSKPILASACWSRVWGSARQTERCCVGAHGPREVAGH